MEWIVAEGCSLVWCCPGRALERWCDLTLETVTVSRHSPTPLSSPACIMRSSTLLLLLACLLACCGLLALAASNTQHETAVRTPAAAPRTLVLLESNELLQTHSAFFSQLRARGHVLEFALAGEPAGSAAATKLAAYGAALFDNVLVLAPTAEDLGDVGSLDSLQRFVDMGRSIMLVGGNSVGEPMRELLAEILGIDVDEEGTRVQDHAAFVAPALSSSSSEDAADRHDLVLGELTSYARNFVGGRLLNLSQPILFRGLGHVAQASALVTPVLAGSPTALSYALGSQLADYPAAAGRDVIMVSALQTRSNARVVYAGSLDMLSNELMFQPLSANGKAAAAAAKSGNEEFVRELSAWVFQERGMLRASKLKHWKVGAEHDVNPTSYRVQDNIVSTN